jgi:hypothetical protein
MDHWHSDPLSSLNRISQNNTHFWRPLAYIPYLGYGKNKANKTNTRDKIQNEHTCLPTAFKSHKKYHRNGGFQATVMGREVNVKVWIHFFIGDAKGNNKWLGHYPGIRKQICQPYQDCCCNFSQLAHPNPTCVHTTLEDMHEAKQLKRENEKEWLLLMKSMSRYDIKNALINKNLHLSDNHCGPYGMMPLELLHTSASGLIKYVRVTTYANWFWQGP